MLAAGIAEPALSLAEAQAFVRVETGEEEALLAGLVRTASAVCEAFINQVLIVRDFSEDLNASGEWQRLGLAPVRSIDLVEIGGGGWDARRCWQRVAMRSISMRRATAGCG